VGETARLLFDVVRQNCGLEPVVAVPRIFVWIELWEDRVLLLQHEEDTVAVDPLDVPHVGAVLDRREDAGARVRAEIAVVGTEQEGPPGIRRLDEKLTQRVPLHRCGVVTALGALIRLSSGPLPPFAALTAEIVERPPTALLPGR